MLQRAIPTLYAVPKPNGQWSHPPRIKAVIEATAQVYKVPVADILSRSQQTHIALPRQVICYILTTYLGKGLQQVGGWIGRDHTTVLHGKRRIEREMPQHTVKINAILNQAGVL